MLLCPEYHFSKKTASGRHKRKKAVSKELFSKQSIKKGKCKNASFRNKYWKFLWKTSPLLWERKGIYFFQNKEKYLGYTKSIQSLQLSDQLRGILMPNVIKNQANLNQLSILWLNHPFYLQNHVQYFCIAKVLLICICTFNLLQVRVFGALK